MKYRIVECKNVKTGKVHYELEWCTVGTPQWQVMTDRQYTDLAYVKQLVKELNDPDDTKNLYERKPLDE